MEIPGISANDPAFGSSQTSSGSELGKDAFMSLLVEQLKNQDPLEPAANEEYIAELANFSSLEEMQELNDNLVGLAVLQQSNALLSQLTEGSALIGKKVHYVDQSTGELASGAVASVKISDGTALLNVDGNDVPLGNVTEVLGEADEAASDSSDDPSGDE